MLEGSFEECLACRVKLGSPLLCVTCLHNRNLIATLEERIRTLEARLRRVEGHRDTLLDMVKLSRTHPVEFG